MIPYNRQSISEEDIESVSKTLRSDFLTQGPRVTEFEESLVKYTGAKYCTAVSSGTAALHLAYLALNISEGDIVWGPAISFVASTNAALYCNADVEFIDIDIQTGCMSYEKLNERLIGSKKHELPKAIVIVDYAGHCGDLEKIKSLSIQYDFKIIEDACHALGSEYKGHKVGSCQFSDITIFSFHPIKSITTGEGGAVLTNNKGLHRQVILLRSHGIIKDEEFEFPWMYEQELLGFNYRITDVQSSLGISQLKKLNEFVCKRNTLVDMYKSKLIGDLTIIENNDCYSSRHLFSILLNESVDHLKMKEIFLRFRSEGIAVQKHYIPIYKQPYYVELYGELSLPDTEDFYRRQISLPLYSDMTEHEVDKIVHVMNEITGV